MASCPDIEKAQKMEAAQLCWDILLAAEVPRESRDSTWQEKWESLRKSVGRIQPDDPIGIEGWPEYVQARRYREIELGVRQMGGWANFKHWVNKHAALYFKTCEELSETLRTKDLEIQELKKELENLREKNDGPRPV